MHPIVRWLYEYTLYLYTKCSKTYNNPLRPKMKPAQCLFILEVTGLLHKMLSTNPISLKRIYFGYSTRR